MDMNSYESNYFLAAANALLLTEVSTGTSYEPIPSLFEQPMLEGYDRVIIYGTQRKRRMLAVACS